MANCDNLLPHTHRSSNYIQHNYDLKTSVNATAADREGHIEKGKKGRVTIDQDTTPFPIVTHKWEEGRYQVGGGDKLYIIGMSDPGDLYLLDELPQCLGLKISWAAHPHILNICTSTYIKVLEEKKPTTKNTLPRDYFSELKVQSRVFQIKTKVKELHGLALHKC